MNGSEIALIAAKILVVEDESVVAWHVQEALQKLGHEVVAIAQTAKEAIQFAANNSPDLVLMDICLQGQTDGVLAAEHLYLNLNLPVVYLTAHADEQTLQRATQTSPFGYLIKPFQEAELHSTIQIALRRHQLERALKDTQQWYATTLVSIGDATIATDVDGFVMFMNPTAELLTGWTQEEALGEFSSRVFHVLDQVTGLPIDDPLLAALCQGDTITILDSTVLRSRDDYNRSISGSAAPIRDRSGQIIGGILVFQDMSDRDELERQLKAQNQHLEQLRSLQDEFLSALAQEMRTPLTKMRLAIEMLQQLMLRAQASEASETSTIPWQKMEQYLKILQAEWQHEFDLVHELLQFRDDGSAIAGVNEVRLQEWLPLFLDRAELQMPSSSFREEIPVDLPALSIPLSVFERLLTQLLTYVSQIQSPISVTASAQRDRIQLAFMCEQADGVGLTASDLCLVMAKKTAIELQAEIKVEQQLDRWCLILTLPIS